MMTFIMILNEKSVLTQLLPSVEQYGVVRIAGRQAWIQNARAH